MGTTKFLKVAQSSSKCMKPAAPWLLGANALKAHRHRLGHSDCDGIARWTLLLV